TMQVFAAEHYCESFHDLTCTAALVRHPLTRQALGVLDVTSLCTESLRAVWELTTESAALMECEIRELLVSSDRVLLEARPTGRVRAGRELGALHRIRPLAAAGSIDPALDGAGVDPGRVRQRQVGSGGRLAPWPGRAAAGDRFRRRDGDRLGDGLAAGAGR